MCGEQGNDKYLVFIECLWLRFGPHAQLRTQSTDTRNKVKGKHSANADGEQKQK